MWFFEMFEISLPKLIVLFLIVAVGFALGKRGRLWLAALAPVAVLAFLVPSPDVFTMLVTLVLLGCVFFLGVYWGPRIRTTGRAQESQIRSAGSTDGPA